MPHPHTRKFRSRATASHRPTRVSPHTKFSRRITVLTVCFVFIGLFYCGILIALQAKGNAYAIYVESPEIPTGGSTETVVVQAVRGEIYDRNGKPLVTNVYSYDIELDYDSFLAAGSVRARNEVLLSLLDGLNSPAAGTSAAEDFPLDGSYPNLTYREDVADSSSSVKCTLDRVLTNIRLKPTADHTELVTYYLETYDLNARTDGIPVYTDAQIDALIRIYYDMDAQLFSAVTPYTLAHDVSSSYIATQMENATPGVRVSVRAERVYHYPGYATHILGRVGLIFAEDWAYYNAMGYPMDATVGVSGCESAFETVLHGTDGEMRLTLDAERHVVAREMLTQPIAGQDIRLTIDIDVQMAAEDALRAQLADGIHAGSVVVMDADTGAYLAIASAPTYDTSDFSQKYEQLSADSSLPLVNRALSTTYAPYKLSNMVTAVAGLAERTVKASTLWTDTGSLTVEYITLTCSKFAKEQTTHGTLGVASALREGCETFFGQLGIDVGNKNFSKWESALGIGLATGIELSENTGKSANIYPGTDALVASAAVGDSDCRMTPAQMCSMLCTVLSNGTRRAGHLLNEIRDFTSGEVIFRKSTEILATTPIGTTEVALLIRTMKNSVLTDMTLYDATAETRANGIDIGMFVSADPSAKTAVSLMFGIPSEDVDSISDSTFGVSVVLEGTTATNRASLVGATVLNACYR